MWRSYLARVLVWFVALAGLGLHATAQTNTGNIYGTVIDDQNQGLPGGTVELTGPQAPRTTTVDEGGRFRFLRVPGGTYAVTITMPGFTTVRRENVIVTLGKDTDVGVQMRLSAVQETVTVTDTTPLLDTRRVQTGATFGKAELEEIPTSRDIYALDPAGPRRPARHGQRRGKRERGRGRTRTSSARARATSPTRSTARRSPTTRTATRSAARTAERTPFSTSRRSTTSR